MVVLLKSTSRENDITLWRITYWKCPNICSIIRFSLVYTAYIVLYIYMVGASMSTTMYNSHVGLIQELALIIAVNVFLGLEPGHYCDMESTLSA